MHFFNASAQRPPAHINLDSFNYQRRISFPPNDASFFNAIIIAIRHDLLKYRARDSQMVKHWEIV
jgi:hypothetical protein